MVNTKKSKIDNSFNIKTHNQKIAAIRDDAWQKNLIKGKLKVKENPSILRKLRTKKEISQVQLARKAQINSASAYARIEQGISLARINTAKEIAEVLGCTPKRIFESAGYKRMKARF